MSSPSSFSSLKKRPRQKQNSSSQKKKKSRKGKEKAEEAGTSFQHASTSTSKKLQRENTFQSSSQPTVQQQTIKAVEQWSIVEVFNWAKTVVKEQHAKKLKVQEVNGSALLSLTESHLDKWSIPGGPALNLITARNKFLSTSGISILILFLCLYK